MATNSMIIKGELEILNEGFFNTLSNYLRGPKIDFQLVSVKLDPETLTGKKSKVQKLELGIASLFNKKTPSDKEKQKNCRSFPLLFNVPEDFGRPEAILVESEVPHEFFLQSITLDVLLEKENTDVDHVIFSTKSWINPSTLYPGPRIFFSDKAYLPFETPEGLKHLRKQELEYLRGDGSGERKKGERIYDYDYYNNLGNPDKDASLARPVLGGSLHLPYPRRCRTGGKHTTADPESEVPSSSPYIPRDEIFSSQKNSDITKVGIRTAAHEAQTLLSGNKHFKSFEEVEKLYAGKLDPSLSSKYALGDASFLKFPPPTVVQANKKAWMTDEEFARQRLAGMNPMKIQRLKTFPPQSTLDSNLYGHEECGITEAHLEGHLEGLSIEEALHEKRLYILDYHDSFITPYVARINESEGKVYASRSLFFLTKAGLLLPISIELILPPKEGNSGETPLRWRSRVFTPPSDGKVDWLWQLAKAHVAVVDASHQHLCSHWLKTHACMEPFIIATRRHLSAMHPIHKLLSPHFKDTMNANSAARQTFLNSAGRIEQCFSTGKYSNEVSAIEYKQWRFDEQAVPKDLIARGMAEMEDGTLRLHIEDYPYAQDALELWAPIQAWAEEYVNICYSGKDEMVATDEELQAWWMEIRHIGHGDHAQASWWGSMSTCADLIDTISTLLWISTGLHSVVDFGQYPFAGFMPNGPTATWLHVPEEGSAEHKQLLTDPPAFFLASLSSQRQATTAMGTFETTSQHMSEETYLGGDGDESPSLDPQVVEAHQRFREAISTAHGHILSRISSPSPHRAGPSNMPFTLLLPFSGQGLTGRGVPNSISI